MSLVFDLLFILQHYVLYRRAADKKDATDGPENEALLDASNLRCS